MVFIMIDWQAQWDNFVLEFITKRGYLNIFRGLGVTMQIAFIGLILGIIIGTLIATVRVIPKYNIVVKILDKICSVYVAFFRGTPMIVQLLVGYWVLFPMLGIKIDATLVASIIFGLNSGAYVSEIMRGGINSVDIGQMEAGRAMGLSFGTTMIKIVIPQAIKNILPTLGNELITLIKETSVVYFISVVDLCRAFQQLGGPSSSFVVPYLMMAAFYVVIVLIVTLLIRVLEKIFSKYDKTSKKYKSKKDKKISG